MLATKKEIGARIQELIKQKNLTTEEVATVLNVKKDLLEGWMHRQKTIYQTNYKKLEDFFQAYLEKFPENPTDSDLLQLTAKRSGLTQAAIGLELGIKSSSTIARIKNERTTLTKEQRSQLTEHPSHHRFSAEKKNTTLAQHVGGNIQALCLKKGWTLTFFCTQVGIKCRVMKKIIAGNLQLRPEQYFEIEELFEENIIPQEEKDLLSDGNFLEVCRLQNGLNKRRLARKVETTVNAITEWEETGIYDKNLEEKISSTLGITFEE